MLKAFAVYGAIADEERGGIRSWHQIGKVESPEGGWQAICIALEQFADDLDDVDFCQYQAVQMPTIH